MSLILYLIGSIITGISVGFLVEYTFGWLTIGVLILLAGVFCAMAKADSADSMPRKI